MQPDLYSRFVNISELHFSTLTALAAKPLHGYGILQEIDAITSGRSKPAVATLYRTLDRLAAEGLVEEDSTEIVDGRFRRTYRLTESGISLLSEEAAARASTARLAKRRLRKRASDPGSINGIVGGLA